MKFVDLVLVFIVVGLAIALFLNRQFPMVTLLSLGFVIGYRLGSERE